MPAWALPWLRSPGANKPTHRTRTEEKKGREGTRSGDTRHNFLRARGMQTAHACCVGSVPESREECHQVLVFLIETAERRWLC